MSHSDFDIRVMLSSGIEWWSVSFLFSEKVCYCFRVVIVLNDPWSLPVEPSVPGIFLCESF